MFTFPSHGVRLCEKTLTVLRQFINIVVVAVAAAVLLLLYDDFDGKKKTFFYDKKNHLNIHQFQIVE